MRGAWAGADEGEVGVNFLPFALTSLKRVNAAVCSYLQRPGLR
ncbi:hypothetical protein GZL_06980 [Streptomyces sp. 769]|nr:hypothetical protein GZL_06980 [Streptomyces sp. 769]